MLCRTTVKVEQRQTTPMLVLHQSNSTPVRLYQTHQNQGLCTCADLDFQPHYFPATQEDLEDLHQVPLAAEDETFQLMACHDAESVVGDWGEEEADSLEDCLALEASCTGSFSCVQYTPVATGAAACERSSATETLSMSGTEGSSPSNGTSPQAASPTIFMSPASSLGVPVKVVR